MSFCSRGIDPDSEIRDDIISKEALGFRLDLLLARIENKALLKDAIRITFEKRPTKVPESFMETDAGFDVRLLRGAWLSLEVDTEVEQFDDHWAYFLTNLKKFI